MTDVMLAGRYQLLDVLGEGANAVVWRALDSASGNLVAVKRLRPALASVEEWRARLRREGRAIVTLRHPGVVRVSELAEEDGGAPYLVMELFYGETLATRLARVGRLGHEEALAIAVPLLDALSAVHAHGLVHRDVKPSNVMLVKELRGDRVVLLDFGLACLLDGTQRVTREGARIGTPVYMSPEQARGVPQIDVRADVWAVGGLLYEMLVGRAPFRASGALEVLHAVIAKSPAPVRTLVPDVPAALDAAITVALSKRPQDRHASASAMASALREIGAVPRGRAAR
ncbi:serine/threonine-protein kinase [Sandaracinus amylolyticus]|uniref:Serine/threonine protein kinase n=1 Tax=Sandaracinus amylolyticus TaxID=927083 RepID=A0A0F6YJE6_9BACT|nr:serine/threonine-protein kinase [Sandaracinus amylolyticus]AKF07247.1 serine/threonine protein kinase [Sandaracinus amylolyticus]